MKNPLPCDNGLKPCCLPIAILPLSGRFRLLLTPNTRFLVMLMFTRLGHDSRPTALPLKPAQRSIEGFILANSDLRQRFSLPPPLTIARACAWSQPYGLEYPSISGLPATDAKVRIQSYYTCLLTCMSTLTRRPTQAPASQEMKMNMENTLSCTLSTVDYNPVSLLGYALLFCQIPNNQMNVTH